jgi:antitoxin HicB
MDREKERREIAKLGATSDEKRRSRLKYPIHIESDTNGQYLVTFPDIPEAATAAKTEEQALLMAVDALESALDFYFDDKRLVPLPSGVKRGQRFVDLPATVAAKAMLHRIEISVR